MSVLRSIGVFVMFLQKAMRYYRMWIYAANAVLFCAVIIFLFFAAFIVADPKMALVQGFQFYHPTLLYAYAALLLQGGVLQTVGCYAAMKLNERFLRIYWLLMLVLLFGDAIVGVAWIFRYNRILHDMIPDLKSQVTELYGKDQKFSDVWNAVQTDYDCCGVESAEMEFAEFSEFPPSCCGGIADSQGSSSTVVKEMLRFPGDDRSEDSGGDSRFIPPHRGTKERGKKDIQDNLTVHPEKGKEKICREIGVKKPGCGARVRDWVRRSADTLFVIGYCVIAFIKVCFLGILRYEIREMVQKIKMLQHEEEKPQLLDIAAVSLGFQGPSTTSPTTTTNNNNNSSHCNSHNAGGKRDSNAQSTPLHLKFNHVDTDSDTNSNCALLLEKGSKGKSGRGKESHEMKEITRPKPLCGKQTQL